MVFKNGESQTIDFTIIGIIFKGWKNVNSLK